MRGGGKSRLLNLITTLSWEGMVLNSITEAVLFRTKGTLAIDEFEGIGRKGNENLRELLNSAYKKTGYVIRMKKAKGKDGEEQVPEKFSVYRPIVMANIYGMEEVLGDRCIETILEKSNRPEITKLIEDFEESSQILGVLEAFSLVTGRVGSFKALKNIQQKWNKFIIKYYGTPHSQLSHTSLYIQHSQHSHLFKKIMDADLLGRDFELFLPLYIIADMCGVLDEMIQISIKITKERREKAVYESKDVQVYDFISETKEPGFVRVSVLTLAFREFLGLDDKQDPWINSSWLGKSLKRLKLIREKRKSSGMLVVLDIDKAKEKMNMFKINIVEPTKQEKSDSQRLKTPKNNNTDGTR